jgi:hypothetical protein
LSADEVHDGAPAPPPPLSGRVNRPAPWRFRPFHLKWRALPGFAAVLLLLPTAPVPAAPVTLGGITFSDELGGVVLHRGWGTGSQSDPFVLVEDITDDGPAVLVVRGLRGRLGGTLGTQNQLGFALRKIVTNRTGRDWHAFELELRERLEQVSTYEDGLSFGQAALSRRGFSADRYAAVDATDEPLDAIVFSDGLVSPGETVVVSAMVTDYTPRDEFFLLQRRESPIAWLGARAPGG